MYVLPADYDQLPPRVAAYLKIKLGGTYNRLRSYDVSSEGFLQRVDVADVTINPPTYRPGDEDKPPSERKRVYTPDDFKSKPYRRWIEEIHQVGRPEGWTRGYYQIGLDTHYRINQKFYSTRHDLNVKAFKKFQKKLKGSGNQLGMTLATADKSMRMFADYSSRFSKGLSYLKKGDVFHAFTALANPGYTRSAKRHYARLEQIRKLALKGKKSRGWANEHLQKQVDIYNNLPKNSFWKEAGSSYLAFTYGFQPLWMEIVNGRKFIDGQMVTALPIRGRASKPVTDYVEYNMPSGQSLVESFHGIARREIGATVSVRNPNLRLMEELGILNIPIVINDLIPFSFVVNWWTQHEIWLSSLTMWAGLNVLDQYQTDSYQVTASQDANVILRYGESPTYIGSIYKWTYMERKTGAIETPSIQHLFQLWPFSSQRRSMNAAALIQQKLKR